MNPPLATTRALLELSLRPLCEALSHVKSYNGAVVFVRDHHYTDQAAAIAACSARVAAKRLEFVRQSIEGRSVDLRVSTLGETFASAELQLRPSRLNRQHMVWGAYVALPASHEAVVQLAFDKTAGAVPSPATIEKAWRDCRDEIVDSLQQIAVRNEPSLIDAYKLDVPVTPNAFVMKWDLLDSSHAARGHYGELRHYITTFESTIEPIVDYYGGHIASRAGDAQTIIVPLTDSVDPSNLKDLKQFAKKTVTPLIDKLRTAHETLAPHYQPVMRIRLGVGLGYIETSQLGEETGPILWDIASKMKMRAGSSELFTLCLDDSVRSLLKS